MATPKILAFGGSLRRGSWNARLVARAAVGATEAGGDVTVLALREYPVPVFDQDLEDQDGLPANVLRLKEAFEAADGLLISSPEYNSSVSGTLKNVIDWVSRPEEGKPKLAGFQGKVAGIMAASPGSLGGLRGLVHLRAILGNLGVLVLPEQRAVSSAHEAFADDGRLTDSRQDDAVLGIGRRLVEVTRALRT